MAHELWLIKEASMTNITPLTGSISWRSNIDELGDEISFTIAFNDTDFFPKNPCDIGDIVMLKNGEEITRAVIVEETRNGRSPVQYTAFDYAFYLNKSTAIYQFNKMSIDAAIKKILGDFGMEIGSIASMSTQIDKIFNNTKVSEIIKELIDTHQQASSIEYLMEMRQGKLYIEEKGNLTITGTFDLADNFVGYNVAHAISNPSRKRSITDMINAIQVVGNDDKLLTEKMDSAKVEKYGKLQKVVQLDQNETKSAAQVAQNELKALSKVFEENSVELPGNDQFRSGRLFSIEEPIIGLSGTYLITDVDHTISNGIHKMRLSLGVI